MAVPRGRALYTAGLSPLSLLEVVGRGAEKPSEMAARLGPVQTSISPLLQRLMAASILTRQIPFGASARNSKKTLYRIDDPTLRFWYRVYSPHRSLWGTYTKRKKTQLLQEHAGTVFEEYCRRRHPGAMRYWEKSVEFDLVRPDPETAGGSGAALIVSEVKWKRTSPREKAGILKDLERRWQSSGLSTRYDRARFEVLDANILEED